MKKLRGRGTVPKKAINKIIEGPSGVEPEKPKGELRRKGLPVRKLEEAKPPQQRAKRYETVTLMGSKGQTYRISVPSSYVDTVPKIWEWNEERYLVAEYIAQGIPLSQIPNMPGVSVKSRHTIYSWLEHPEFREHVDGLVLETGWANRRERLMNLQRLNNRLLEKVLNEIDEMKLTDRSVGAILNAIQAGAKLIAQEKGEFVEEQKVTSNVSAKVEATTTLKVDELLKSASDDERRELEEAFDQIGDDIIRNITGE